ncbi:hypothetical protein HB825_05920 [Listeria booriae]|uniref:T7SS effector LXG polymorphic toxin n=1 Tax=Listeria booriae TaxID=1552123 RepID=UPI0016231FC1|nr:T7SS effector LXG polymorphic toxin [Listeria booriae]MBC1528735.1 hypothetical protein [Listeria booriae]MBC6134370.1 hypothetical protein [Listeria booriae]
MSYLIKYDDITNFSGYAGQKLNTYQEQLTLIQNSLQGIVGLDQLKGSAADSIKNYLNEVHSSLIASIQQLITEYQAHFLLYKDGYYQEIDSDPHTQIDEDVLIDKKSFFNTSNTDFENTYADFVSGIRNIQDILPSSSVNPNGLRQDYTEINRHIDTLKEKTGNYEAQHQKDDLTNFKSMLLSIQQLIKENQAKPQGVTTYQTGDIASFPSAASLTGALQKSNEFLQVNSVAIQAASGRESERWDALKAEEEARLAEEREKQGWLQLVGGAAAVLVGGAAIVLTAGAATPIVVGVGAVAFGSIAYGASEMIEGGQQVYYGMKGDGYTFATNPLRDTLFMGNQAAYDTFGLLTTTASSIVIPGALAARSAIAAGRIVGVADIAITASSRAALGEIGGLLLSRGLPPVLEPYVGGDWATGIGLVSGLVAAAGGGAWAVRGVNSALDIPSAGVFKPHVTGRGSSEQAPSISPPVLNAGEEIVERGSGSRKISKEVEIINENGSPLGEFDEIDLEKGVFYEDKTAKGLDVVNPRTGLPTQTPEQFAEKQIYQKTVNRIKNLEIADATRPTVNGSQSIPSLEEIKCIKKFVFRLDGNSAELQNAVNQIIAKLKSEFPGYTFEVIFGGK